MVKKIAANLTFALGAILLGALIYSLFLRPASPSSKPPAKNSTDILFASTLLDIHNTAQTFQQYKGKILVVNFWASKKYICRCGRLASCGK